MKSWTLLLVVLVALVAPSAHAADVPASEASIRELIEMTRPQEMLDVARAQVESSMAAGFREGAADASLSPRQQEVLTEYRARLLALVSEELDWSKLEPMFIDTYSKAFTQKEIDDILAFYRTPSCKALIEKMPALMQTVMQQTQVRMRDLIPKLKELQKEMAEKIRAANT